MEPKSAKESHSDESQKCKVVETHAFRPGVLHQSCNHRERRVLKCTLTVVNDTTVHGVHADTVAFTPSLLIEWSVCSVISH